MVTFLITSILFLGLIAIAIYFWQKPAKARQTIELPPPPPVTSLFETEDPKQLAATTTGDEQQVLTTARNKTDESGNGKPLTNELIDSWRECPDRASTTRLLHAAALSDDANTYCDTVELVLSAWQDEGISGMSAADLQNLLNSEFWLLSSNTRNSGAGFVLKRTLSRAMRELERANNKI